MEIEVGFGTVFALFLLELAMVYIWVEYGGHLSQVPDAILSALKKLMAMLRRKA